MTDQVIYISAEIPVDAVVRSPEKGGPHLIGNAKTQEENAGFQIQR